MGGASQGNLGVAFGSRRQITSQAPSVPSLAEKEKRLKEKIEQEKRELEERQRHEQAQREAEEERLRLEEEQARLDEERRWREETRKLQEQEELHRRAEEEQQLKRDREAAEAAERAARQLRMDQEAAEARRREADLAKQRSRQRTTSDARLNGQFLSQYQADQAKASTAAVPTESKSTGESQRIADLERQLEELRAQQRQAAASSPPPMRNEPLAPSLPSRNQDTSHQDDWDASEREYLRKEHQRYASSNYDDDGYTPPKPPRPEPAEPARPLPNPDVYQPGTNRTERYLASNPAPVAAQTRSNRPDDFSTTTEVDLENQRRAQSQAKTKAGGWASKSLLEREMERERERQREWEEGQKSTAAAARDMKEGSKPGQTWDVNQYGYMGGDSQNRGGPGLGVGGPRRQIIGPRPPP